MRRMRSAKSPAGSDESCTPKRKGRAIGDPPLLASSSGPGTVRLAPRAQEAILFLPRVPQVLRHRARERRPRGDELVDPPHDLLVAERGEHRLREILDEILVARRRESR